MAFSFKRPVLMTTRQFSSPLARHFSPTSHLCSEAKKQPRTLRNIPNPERSLRVDPKKAQQLPSDIGLLLETFVPPTGANRPSLFKSPSLVVLLEWKRFCVRCKDLLSIYLLKFASPKDKNFWKRKVTTNRSVLTPTAIALHRRMYTAFAEGDMITLRQICADGVYDSFGARIGNRQRGEKVVWDLVKYNKRAKLVSNKAARLPVEGTAIQQAVVQISSTQKLTRFFERKNGHIEQIPGSGKEKNVVEYVVIQRKFVNWVSGDWKAWGTINETTLEDVASWEKELL